MKNIIAPVSKKLLISELTQDKFIRTTNYGNNEIYIFSYHDSPNLMRETGRLREIAFRIAGGGTGKSLDIDNYDLAEIPYKQLIVWDKKNKEIIGGYRFINLKEIPPEKRNKMKLATKGLFKFSEKFVNEYMPYTIELGRSFIQPEFQAGKISRKTLFALDNLWDGLAALTVLNPEIKYFFGKVTMYTNYDKFARDLILYFLKKYFDDKEKLVYPIKPLNYFTDKKILKKIFIGKKYFDNYKILSKEVREKNENIPPLINSYMNLSPTMKCFGTSINAHFGNVEETGIMITIPDIYENKKKRHFLKYSGS